MNVLDELITKLQEAREELVKSEAELEKGSALPPGVDVTKVNPGIRSHLINRYTTNTVPSYGAQVRANAAPKPKPVATGPAKLGDDDYHSAPTVISPNAPGTEPTVVNKPGIMQSFRRMLGKDEGITFYKNGQWSLNVKPWERQMATGVRNSPGLELQHASTDKPSALPSAAEQKARAESLTPTSSTRDWSRPWSPTNKSEK